MSKNKTTETIQDDLVHLNRVTKVVKGGRNFSFAALVVVGDKKGNVGVGTGKAKEVMEARSKAVKEAKSKMFSVPLYKNRTIHYDIIGKSGAAKVILRRAAPGTGVIAGGPLRSIFGLLGVQDIVAKSLGSSNPNSMIAAAVNALQNLTPPKLIAERRSMHIGELSVNSAKTE